MDQQTLADALEHLTGGLAPGPATSASDLDAARSLIASALSSGQSAASIAASIPAAEYAAAQTIATTAPAALAFLRPSPVPRAESAGMSVRTLGPFIGPGGVRMWLDAVQPAKGVLIVRDPPIGPPRPPAAIGMFPIALVQPNPNEVRLDAGSVWIAAPLLAANSPKNAITGFRIKGGALTLHGHSTVIAGVVHIGPLDVLSLTAEPDPPATAAVGVVANIPAKVGIEFQLNGGRFTEVADFNATIYGAAVAETRNANPPRYDSTLQSLLVPAGVTPANFTVAHNDSTFFFPSGTAPITGGAWALSVARTALTSAGEAAGAGAIAVFLGPGLQARWSNLTDGHASTAATLLAAPDALAVIVSVQTAPFSQTFDLWQESADRRSSLEFDYARQFTLRYVAQNQTEMISAAGSAKAHLDRPRRVDGSRFAIFAQTASLQITSDAAGQFLILTGEMQPPNPNPVVPIALQNALLKVNAPQSVQIAGVLNAAAISNGHLFLNFPLVAIIPILPDPYAAFFPHDPAALFQGLPGTLTAIVTWPDPASPSLAFTASQLSVSQQFLGVALFRFVMGLLDLSSNVDQLGVGISGDPHFPNAVDINGLALRASGGGMALFTVPEISWEPMINDPTSQSPGPPLANDDGGPSGLTINTVRMVPVAPKLVLDPFFQDFQSGLTVNARLTLPFGLAASAQIQKGAVFELNQPAFSNALTGGLQIKMQPPSANSLDATFPGRAATVDGNNQYGSRVLGTDVGASHSNLALAFNQRFQSSVPLRRYDLSGYGASVFSDWRNQNAGVSDIIKVQFDVFVGRTAYEVIEEQNMIFPWGIKVVRTVTIERKALGGILRYDSGWRAASDGTLVFPNQPGAGVVICRGALDRVTNVRNIRPTGSPFPAGPQVWEMVLFDGDVLMVSPGIQITEGASAPNLTTSRDMTGYLLQNIVLVPPPIGDITALMSGHTASGPLSCTVNIASTNARMRASAVDVSLVPNFIAGGTVTFIVAALRGSPVLPADGAWSIAKRPTSTTKAPDPLPANFPVPLIQLNSNPKWHFTDPSEIFRLDAPQVEYGWMQSTGTQKMFFARPQLTPNQPAYHMPVQPHLADVASLFNAPGIFPDLGAALQVLDGADADLAVSGDGLKIHKSWNVPPTVGPNTLVDFGVVKVLLDYETIAKDKTRTPARATVDVAPGSWHIQLQGVTFPVFTPMSSDITNPLIRITGDIDASSTSAPTFKNLNVVYGGFLDPVQTLFCNLQQIAKFIPGFGPPQLDVSFSDGKLTIRDVFALPKLPLGVGFITDVALIVGMTMRLSPQSLDFSVGIGSEQKPFHWLVSPLSGTGCVQVGVQDGKLAVLIQAGIGAGLSIDVGIASGAASVVIAFQVQITGSNVLLKGILTIQASVDVLDGLASASLTLAAGLGISPNPFPPRLPSTKPLDSVTLVASVMVGIHLTVGWLVHVDFDGYWQFSQTLDVPDVGAVLPF